MSFLKNIEKILVIRLSGIGDILFTLPAINMIKENYPQSEITFLTLRKFASLINGFPAVNKVISFDREVYKQKKLKEIFCETKALLHSIQKENFDLIIDLHGFGETALLSWLSGTKSRWGNSNHKFRSIFYTLNVKRDNHNHIHIIDRQLDFLIKAGLKLGTINNNYVLPNSEISKAQQLLEEFGYSSLKPTIFIQPFTYHSFKNWPLDNYLQYAEYWNQRGVQIVFGGGPADKEKLTKIAAKYPVTAGKASLLTNAGLMGCSSLIIGGDTGLLHIATAMGKQVLMLMGPTSPKGSCPYKHPDWVISATDKKMDSIQLDQVIAYTKKIFNY